MRSFLLWIQNHMYLVDIIKLTHNEFAQKTFYENPTSVSGRSFLPLDHLHCLHSLWGPSFDKILFVTRLLHQTRRPRQSRSRCPPPHRVPPGSLPACPILLLEPRHAASHVGEVKSTRRDGQTPGFCDLEEPKGRVCETSSACHCKARVASDLLTIGSPGMKYLSITSTTVLGRCWWGQRGPHCQGAAPNVRTPSATKAWLTTGVNIVNFWVCIFIGKSHTNPVSASIRHRERMHLGPIIAIHSWSSGVNHKYRLPPFEEKFRVFCSSCQRNSCVLGSYQCDANSLIRT